MDHTMPDQIQGAFEVRLVDADGRTAQLWSKLETGEPSHLGAASALAEYLTAELRDRGM